MIPPSSLPLTPLSTTELVVLLREELKQHWRAGRPTRVEEFLGKYPQARIADEGVLDLIYQEIVVREEIGEQPTLEEYRQRFPPLAALLERQFALHQMLKNSELDSLVSASPMTLTATALERPAILSGSSLGLGVKIHHYCLEGELGRGGMGIVFKARDERLQRTVALKLLLGHELASEDQLQRFRVEAEILAQLQHPNIVQIFEIGNHEESSFFAMEYVAGNTLQEKVRENPLVPLEAARVVHLLAEAMHTAHAQGIIHRDLKPSNVLLTSELIPKITDFGLARQGQSERTAPGAVMGTPSYMAPEQALGQQDRIGPATDVYALGAILFELLTGRAPFRGATVPSTLHQVIHADPPAPRRLQPGIPRDLETICLKCLEKNSAKRYASAQALADDLQRWLRGEPIQARPIHWLEYLAKWARREPKVAFLATTVFLVALIGFLAVVLAWQAERRARQNTEEQLYFARISYAVDQLAKGKLAWAEDALAKCPEFLRAWEWHHLSHRCKHGDAEVIETPGAVSNLATHPWHTSFVVGCHNGRILILDEGKLTRAPFLGHLGSVNWVMFDPGGSEFFSGGEDGRIHGWKLSTGEKIKTFTDHQGPISCLAFHPRKAWIASTTFDGPDSGTVLVWHRETGERVHTLQNHTARVTGLAFHPSGKLLATASHDHTITLWDCQTGKILRVLSEHRSPIACLAFSPDGDLLASSAGRAQSDRPDEDEIFVWNAATGNVLHRLQGHDKRAVALAFVPGGKRLATAGWDKQVKIWDLQTGQEVLTLIGHHDGIMTLGFDAQSTLLTGSLDQTIRLWKITQGNDGASAPPS